MLRSLFNVEGNSEQQVDMSQPYRILVLGSSPHTRLVDAYNWDNLPPHLNVADYDAIILNFVPFIVSKELARGINLDTLPSREQFARLLFSSSGEIIAIGIPTTRLGTDRGFMYVSWWLPGVPRVINESGHTVQNIAPEFEFYFQHVRQWFFIRLMNYLLTLTTKQNLIYEVFMHILRE